METKTSAEKDMNIFYDELILRIKMLEETIREAVYKLEETKKSFKSKRVKEVREKLSNAINIKS